MSSIETAERPFVMPTDLPPAQPQPSGISFDSQLPEDIDALNHSSNIVPVPDGDEIGPYPYDVVDQVPDRSAAEFSRAVTLGQIYVLMASWDWQQRAAVRAYYGLGAGEPLAYRQIAEQLGISYDRARKFVREGITTLRASLEAPLEAEETAELAPESDITLEEAPAVVPPAPAPAVSEASAVPAPASTEPPLISAAPPARLDPRYRRHILPYLPEGPTVHVAADVGDSKWTVDFDIERYAAALRAQGLPEGQISDRVVLIFAGRTVANWLLAPGGAAGETAIRREGGPLGPLRTSGGRWDRGQLIAVQAGRDADYQLAYRTLAMAGRLPLTEEYEDITAKSVMKVVGAAVFGTGIALSVISEFVLAAPEFVEPFGLLSLAGLGASAVGALLPDNQQRAVNKWQKEFGPIITVRPRQPRMQRLPLVGRLSGIIKRDES